jgi:hypothetical protein
MDTDTTAGPLAPPEPATVTPPDPPALIVTKALGLLNHPGNLSITDRLHAMEVCMRAMAAQLIPLLPTE